MIAGLTMGIGLRVAGSVGVSITASVLATLFPYSPVQNVGLIDTALFTTLLLSVAMLALVPTNWWRLVGVGAAGAAAILTRPAAVLVVIVALVYLGTQPSVRLRIWVPLSITVGGVGVWILRDYLVLGSPIFVATNGGWNLWLGNNPFTAAYLASGRSLDRIEFEQGIDWAPLATLGEVTRDQLQQHASLMWATAQPLSAIRGVALKAFYTVMPILRPASGAAKGLAFAVSATPLYLSAAWAGLTLRTRPSVLLIAVIGAIVLSEIVFFPYTRLLSPTFPLMAVLGTAGVAKVVRERRPIASFGINHQL
jgi:hypothetical protein